MTYFEFFYAELLIRLINFHWQLAIQMDEKYYPVKVKIDLIQYYYLASLCQGIKLNY